MSTDTEAAVAYHADNTQRDVNHMTERELLHECVLNQRVLIQQQAAILNMFQDIQSKVMEGGIGGLLKGMMGR